MLFYVAIKSGDPREIPRPEKLLHNAVKILVKCTFVTFLPLSFPKSKHGTVPL